MTKRQQDLVNLLMSEPYRWWTQKEICDNIGEYHYINDSRNHCVDIGDDRIAINADTTCDKIIVVHKHCFKIADFSDYYFEHKRLSKIIINTAKQLRDIKRKYKRHMQGHFEHLGDTDLKMAFYETFSEEDR